MQSLLSDFSSSRLTRKISYWNKIRGDIAKDGLDLFFEAPGNLLMRRRKPASSLRLEQYICLVPGDFDRIGGSVHSISDLSRNLLMAEVTIVVEREDSRFFLL